MDSYYSDLTTSALQKALNEMKNARQYAANAKAPEYMLKSMKKISSGIHNKINEVLSLRTIKR